MPRRPPTGEKKPLRKVFEQPEAFEYIFTVLGNRVGVPIAAGLPVGHGPHYAPLPLGATYRDINRGQAETPQLGLAPARRVTICTTSSSPSLSSPCGSPTSRSAPSAPSTRSAASARWRCSWASSSPASGSSRSPRPSRCMQQNPWAMVGWAFGFGSGTYIGITVEKWLAAGHILMRVISVERACQLRDALLTENVGVTRLAAKAATARSTSSSSSRPAAAPKTYWLACSPSTPTRSSPSTRSRPPSAVTCRSRCGRRASQINRPHNGRPGCIRTTGAPYEREMDHDDGGVDYHSRRLCFEGHGQNAPASCRSASVDHRQTRDACRRGRAR